MRSMSKEYKKVVETSKCPKCGHFYLLIPVYNGDGKRIKFLTPISKCDDKAYYECTKCHLRFPLFVVIQKITPKIDINNAPRESAKNKTVKETKEKPIFSNLRKCSSCYIQGEYSDIHSESIRRSSDWAKSTSIIRCETCNDYTCLRCAFDIGNTITGTFHCPNCKQMIIVPRDADIICNRLRFRM